MALSNRPMSKADVERFLKAPIMWGLPVSYWLGGEAVPATFGHAPNTRHKKRRRYRMGEFRVTAAAVAIAIALVKALVVFGALAVYPLVYVLAPWEDRLDEIESSINILDRRSIEHIHAQNGQRPTSASARSGEQRVWVGVARGTEPVDVRGKWMELSDGDGSTVLVFVKDSEAEEVLRNFSGKRIIVYDQ